MSKPLAETLDNVWAARIADEMEELSRPVAIRPPRARSAPTVLSIVSPAERRRKRLLKAHEQRDARMNSRRRGYWHTYSYDEDGDSMDFQYGWTQYRKLK